MKLAHTVIILSITTMILAIEKHQPKDCQNICTMEFDAVCAGEPNEKPKSFANVCVMNNYNCENNKNLVVVSKGECPGGGGIRLS